MVGKHEGLVAAMADGYHRVSGKVGVVIAHVMGGSHQLAGQLFNAQVAGSSLLVVAGDWASELQDYRGLAPFPGLSQAESMRPITKEARCAYQVHTNPAAISVATIRALREATRATIRPICFVAPSTARSTYREYASRAAIGRRLASGPFSSPLAAFSPTAIARDPVEGPCRVSARRGTATLPSVAGKAPGR